MSFQLKLPLHPRSSRTAKLNGYDEANLRSARIVLENVQRFGGEGAGLVRWARAVIWRLGDKTSEPRNGLGQNEELSGRAAAIGPGITERCGSEAIVAADGL
jgi:hypothetical protein